MASFLWTGRLAWPTRWWRPLTVGFLACLWPALAAAASAEAEWSCGPPSLGAPCPQSGPATLALGDGTPRGLGNPVHLDSGHKYQHEIDWHALEGELGLEVVRHYQSADPRDMGLGRGWRLSYDTRVYPVGQGWQVVQADGSRLWFLPAGEGADHCVAVGVEAGRLLALPEGGYHWTWPNGRQLRFDAQGRLVEIEGRGGARLTLWRGQVPGRHDFGRVLRVRDPRGREMQLRYEGARLVAIRLPEGELRYWHAAGGRLRGVGYPSGRARLYGYQQAYQGEGREAGARLTATWWWDADAGLLPRWAWTYDGQGRVVEVWPGGRRGSPVTLSYGTGFPFSPARAVDVSGTQRGAGTPSAVAGSPVDPMNGEASRGGAGPGQILIEAGGVARMWRPARLTRAAHAGAGSGITPGLAQAAGAGAAGVERTTTLQLPGGVGASPRRLQLDWTAPPGAGAPGGLPWRIAESGWREPATPGEPPLAVRREWRWLATAPGAGADAAGRGWRLRRSGEATAWPDPARAEAGWPGLRLWRDDLGTIWRWESEVTGRFERQPAAEGQASERWRFGNGAFWSFEYDEQGRLRRWQRQDPGGAGDVVEIARELGWVRVGSGQEHETWWQLPDARAATDGAVEAARRGRDGAGAGPGSSGGTGLNAGLSGARRRVARDAMGAAPAWRYEEALWRDADGRLLAHDLPEGGRLAYRHDRQGRLVEVLWHPAAGPSRSLYQRHGGGVTLANGSRVGAALPEGRLALLWQALPDGRLLLAHRRSYDAAGRPVAESLRVAGGPPRHRSLDYDEQGRLAVVVQDGVEQRLAWAPEGTAKARWEATDGPALAPGPDPFLEPVSEPRRARVWVPPPVRRDASGLPEQVGGRQLSYGPGRRLASVVLADGRRVRYFHNARGEQIGRDDGQETTQALYLGHQRVAEAGWQDGEWRITRRLVLAGELPVAWIEYRPGQVGEAATVFTLHADAMGIPLAATDDAGRLRWRAHADAWGRLQTERGGIGLALRLPGQWADALTGWHDNYLRTYDPTWGHYLEPDPAGPPGAQAPGVGSATAFGYAGHQPRRWLDPTGLVLFAFDGTLQDAGSGANVHRLSLWYRDAAAVAAGLSSAYYQAGPGGWPIVDLDAAMAWSAERIVQTQWDQLLRHLSAFETAADPVALDLLGYSRGAALARHFANRIVGKVRQGRFWDWDDELGAVTACVDTRFMGLFDTVAQFGLLGARDAVFDLAIAPAWRGVAHAVALHERRALFPLVSIGGPGVDLPEGWEERPFVGAHGDIGGGLVAPGELQPGEAVLSDVSLQWIADQAAALGAWLDRSDPPVEGEWARLHDFRTPYQRLAGFQGDRAGGPVPGVPASDRAVRAAAGASWLAAQAAHGLLGGAQRSAVESWIERTERWLSHPEAAVGRVDLDAYRRWRDALP